MKTIIKNGKVYTSAECIAGKDIIINNGKIESIGTASDEDRSGAEIIDARNMAVAPGYIDCQVNGGGGVLLNDDISEKGFRAVADAHLKCGTTSILPTLLTDDLVKLKKGLTVAGGIMAGQTGYGILGVHLEGPFIGQSKAGIHNKAYIKDLTDEELAYLFGGSHSCRIMTVDPKKISKEQITYLIKRGIHVFAGHSDATCAETLTFFGAGGAGSTHLFNAMSGISAREPGIAGATIFDDKAYAGIIADGVHVDFVNIANASRLMKGRLFFVSDAMPPVGSDITQFDIGGVTVFYRDGKWESGGGTLGGSAVSIAASVKNGVFKAGIPMGEALRMSSTYQAEMLGYGDVLGKILPGHHADLVFLNESLDVVSVMKNGFMLGA